VWYLTAEEVARFNAAEVGENLLADFGLLDSAIQRPQTTVGGHDAYPDIHTKAAALFHSITRNHPFIDGNKRTAVIAAYVFYGLNDHVRNASQDDMIALAVDTSEGLLDVDAIAALLKQWVD
jgi:death-on-curing protein